jgi:hypothetical protein
MPAQALAKTAMDKSITIFFMVPILIKLISIKTGEILMLAGNSWLLSFAKTILQKLCQSAVQR